MDDDKPLIQDDETAFKQDLKKGVAEPAIVDAGNVMMLMAVEGHGMVPVPVTKVFQELFSIINHLDSRVCNCENKLKIDPNAGDSQIITLN